LAKSAKWRERQRAYEAGQLYQWEAEQAARVNAAPPAPRRDAPTPPQSPFDNYERISTPEGASWPADETGYSRYMVWRLPVSSGSNRPTPPRT
jgi:hypothetical protein